MSIQEREYLLVAKSSNEYLIRSYRMRGSGLE